ncbi:MAG: sulfatase-like hydrolase/transferase [Acidobacteriota bacterium]
MRTLDRLVLARQTLVIFTNDNGGEWLSPNTPLFHRKDTLWKGGIRVPAIFRWPGRLPAGRTSKQPGITMDLSASILGATNTAVPSGNSLDGIDLLPTLAGKARPKERTFFWRINGEGRVQKAVRRGEWKLLIDGDDLLLFNLRTDIGERHDLAMVRPDIVRVFLPLIRAWEFDVDTDARFERNGRK